MIDAITLKKKKTLKKAASSNSNAVKPFGQLQISHINSIPHSPLRKIEEEVYNDERSELDMSSNVIIEIAEEEEKKYETEIHNNHDEKQDEQQTKHFAAMLKLNANNESSRRRSICVP